jgi:hypothetical protein
MNTVTDSFPNIQLNADETAFLAALADQTQAFNFLVILFGFAQVATQPTSPEELGAALLAAPVTVNAPSWLDAVNGAQNIVAGTASQSVQLFILGHYPGPNGDMMGKKPQQQNVAFFTDLEIQYTNMLNP